MKNFNYRSKGFTLIEFLVAMGLATVIILAASSTYLITKRLNNQTQSRLNIQQNLRNAASMITRDARNAGTFGCFNTSPHNASFTTNLASFTNVTANAGKDDSVKIKLDRTLNDGFGIFEIPQNQVSSFATGFVANSNMIVFVYGKGGGSIAQNLTGVTRQFTLSASGSAFNDPEFRQVLEGKGDVVISDCANAIWGKLARYNIVNGNVRLQFTGRLDFTGIVGRSSNLTGEIWFSRFYAAAYVLGTVGNNGAPSLLRYEIGGNGEWVGPQLLAENVNSMSYNYVYVSDCTNDNDSQNTEKFTITHDLNQPKLPALVRFRIGYDNNRADYIINASVRGGNGCAVQIPAQMQVLGKPK